MRVPQMYSTEVVCLQINSKNVCNTLILLSCSLSHTWHCNNSPFSVYSVLNLKQQMLWVKVTLYFDLSNGFCENVIRLLIINCIHSFFYQGSVSIPKRNLCYFN